MSRRPLPPSIFIFDVVSGLVVFIRRFSCNLILFHFCVVFSLFRINCRNVAIFSIFCFFFILVLGICWCLCLHSLFASISLCQSSCSIIASLLYYYYYYYHKDTTAQNTQTLYFYLCRCIFIILFFPRGSAVLDD